jgi:hypothetical protein
VRYFKKWYETRAEALPVENCKSYRDWFNRKDLRLIHLIDKIKETK